MTNYPIIGTRIAANDLKAIIQYIHRDNPKTAVNLFTKLKAAASDLALFPERERIVPELLAHGIGHYRELIVPPWRIMYRFSEERVYILAVIDARRNIEDVLLGRLIR